MTTKTQVIIGIIVVCTAFAAGRYATPEKVRIEKQIVEVEKKTTDSQTEAERNKHKETTVVEVTKPDGTKETTTKTVEDSNTAKQTNTQATDDTTKTEKSVEERSRSKVMVAAMVGLPLSLPATPVYGAQVVAEVIGPISTGVWALTNGVAGVSLGLTF